MVEMHPARGAEREQAEALWTAVFGDSAEAQRVFYRLSGEESPLVLTEDGCVKAMLALPEMALTFGDGWSVKGGYVYALATAPESRGKGYAALLLKYAGEICKNRGYDCIFTVPAQPSLFGFFAQNGFEPAFYHRRVTARPGQAAAEELSPADYARLREELLAGNTHVTHSAGLLGWQKALCPGAGSGLFRLSVNGGNACAAVECWPGHPVVKELLCAPEDEALALGAAAALCGGEAEVRLPAAAEDGEPFAAIRWLYGAAPSRWKNAPGGWFGPGYD